MALVCPVAVPQTSEDGCVGNFVSPELEHLVTPDGYDLVFEQLLPSTNQPAVRLHVAANGNIVGLYRVPSAPKSGSGSALDMLLIHTQTCVKDTEETSAHGVLNHLHFKVYDMDSQELTSVSTFTYDSGPQYPLSLSQMSVTVCVEAGPHLGVVAFSNSATHATYFLDPLNTGRVTTYNSNEPRGVAPVGGQLHWASADLMVVARKRPDQMSYSLDFLKIARRPRNAKSSFKITSIDRVTLLSGLKVKAVGSVITTKNETRINAVLSDDSVSIYSVKDSEVVLVQEKRLDLPRRERTEAYGILERSRYRSWSRLPASRRSESYFLSDDGATVRVQDEDDLSLFKATGIPKDAMLSPLGMGFFKIRTHCFSPVQLIKIKTAENPHEPSISVEILKSRSYEFNSALLLKHEYDSYFGNSFVFSFKDSTNYLCKSERTLNSSISAIENYPFTTPISGIWLIHDQIIVSTAAETAVYKLIGHRLERVMSEFDGDHCTIAAAPGVQVTQDAVLFAGGLAVSLPFSAANMAAISGDRVYVANADTVVTIDGGRVVETVEFDDVIVGLDCWHSTLAICTVSALHIRRGESGELKPFPLRDLATTVACGFDEHVYVGDAAGNMFIWPDQKYVNVTTKPIKSVRTQGETGITVLAGPDGSALIDANQSFVRLRVADASDLQLFAGSMHSGLGLFDGVMKIVDIETQPAMEARLIDASDLLHSRPEHVKVWGDFIYSFWFVDSERRLQRAPLSDIGLIQSFGLPPRTRNYLSDFQVFMLSETQFLVFARIEPMNLNMDSDNNDDDSDGFDDFDTQISVTLYELQEDLGKVAVLNEKEFNIPGDPFEEIVVKFYSPHDFILFTHSSSAVAGSVDKPTSGVVNIGNATSCYEYLYDDHWLPTNKGGVLIVTFSGDIFRVSEAELQNTEPIVDCFRNPRSRVGQVSESRTGDAIFNALTVGGLGGSSGEPAGLVVTSRDKSGGPSSKASLLDVGENKVVKLADVHVHDRYLSLAPVNKNMATSLLSGSQNKQSKYLAALMPSVAIGTTRGGVFLLSRIQDETLASALFKVQGVLRQSIELLDSTLTKREENIDGALLMAALGMPEAEPVFAQSGLDAQELRKALKALCY